MQYKDFLKNLTDLEKIALENEIQLIKKLIMNLYDINLYIN